MTASEALALPLEVIAAGQTDRGCVRSANEDSLLVRPDLGLYVVADGAGGHSAGNVASAIATTAVAKHFDATDAEYRQKPEVDGFGLWTGARRIAVAVQRANAAVIEIARTSNKYRGMGTTIVCALVSPETGRLHIAHAGDSRCYRLRGGVLECLTQDHSIITDVIEQYPELEDEAISRLPRKAVTRALGMEPTLRVSVRSYDALVGDRYLLCSDGLTNELREAVLAEMLGASSQPSDIAADLVRLAKEAGGRDNVTALVLECRKGADADEPRTLPRFRRPAISEPDIVLAEEEGSQPEIVLIRSQGTSGDDLSDPRISVVPVTPVDSQMIQALDRVASVMGGSRKCPRCTADVEGTAATCSRCGYSMDEQPPSRR